MSQSKRAAENNLHHCDGDCEQCGLREYDFCCDCGKCINCECECEFAYDTSNFICIQCDRENDTRNDICSFCEEKQIIESAKDDEDPWAGDEFI